MKIKLITGEFCSRCHMIEPLLKKYAEENWCELEVKDVKEASVEEIEWATMLPVIWFDNDRKDYDEVLELVMK